MALNVMRARGDGKGAVRRRRAAELLPVTRRSIGKIVRILVALCLTTLTSQVSAQTKGATETEGRQVLEEELTASGPAGALKGTLTLPDDGETLRDNTPVFLIVPGSGPTDRDGNSPLGIAAAPYKLLAEALASRGFPSVRIDKRGMFGSKDAVSNPNDVTIDRYGDDLVAWASAIQARFPTGAGARCIIPIGHSEGGLVALAAVGRLPNACGIILIASIGRPMDQVISEQLRANPANAPFLAEAEAALATLKRGERVDQNTLSPALLPLFATEVQGFLMDTMSYDPAEIAATTQVPMLIVQGLRDIQVTQEDAKMLAAAAPKAQLALIPDVNHALKVVETDELSANLSTYANPALPISSAVVDVIERFTAEVMGQQANETD